jgi:hypothetical protein
LICVVCSIRGAVGRIGSIVDGPRTSRICCFVRRVRCVASVLICFFELRPQLIVFGFEFVNTLLQLFPGRLVLTACCQRECGP